MDMLSIETITTLPIVPLEHPAFIEEVLRPEPRPRSHRPDPIWAQVLVILGSLFLVCSGSFIITTQLAVR